MNKYNLGPAIIQMACHELLIVKENSEPIKASTIRANFNDYNSNHDLHKMKNKDYYTYALPSKTICTRYGKIKLINHGV